MTLAADIYYSFRSPYSYMAVIRCMKLTQEYDLTIHLRTVWPLAVRDPQFFEREHRSWISYFQKDIFRVAEFQGVKLVFPRPDPITQDMKTREIAADQPLIGELSRLGIVAQRRGAGIAFAQAISSRIWGGTERWNEDEHLEAAAAEAGLSLAEMRADIEADVSGIDAEIDANQTALEDAGHWGVPTFVFEGEPFFGQDRIDLLVWRMQQKGLTKRA